MPKNLPNISYDIEKGNPIVDSDSSLYNIPFYKSPEYFSNIDSRNNFIKGVEKLVRTDDRYNKYIAYLKNDIGLDTCQVLSGFNDEDCSIEMHHGPIFTLYDYCEMVLDYFVAKEYKITTFRIADVVLEEHRKNHIQVVMLSSTVHEEVHQREVFINMNQAWGDLHGFLKKYGHTMNEMLKDKYNRYIDKSMMMDSSTYDIFKLNEKLIQ